MNIMELHEKQLELESLSAQWTAERYERRCTSATTGKRRSESSMGPGFSLTRRVIPVIAGIIEKDIGKAKGRGSAGRARKAREWLRGCGLKPEEMAYIAFRVVLNRSAMKNKKITLQTVASQVYNNMWAELEIRKFKEDSPSYLWAIEQSLKGKSKSEHIRLNIMLRAKKKLEIADTEKLSQEDRFKVGKYLVDIMVHNLGLFKYEKSKKGHRATVSVVYSDDLIDYLGDGHQYASTLAPIHMPMIIKPLPWSASGTGGYLSKSVPLMSIFDQTGSSASCTDIARPVRKAVNAIQEVPWRINVRILDVLKTLIKANSSIAGLPFVIPMPPVPWDDTPEGWKKAKEEDHQAYVDYCVKRRLVHTDRLTESGKMLALKHQLKVGDLFKEYSEIFFPHFLDWRGRIYPMPQGLNPQGNDTAKSLLEFAKGKPLDSAEAQQWFMVHGANCYGEDKCNFAERIAWVKENHERILEAAHNPIDGTRWWSEADSPFKFLAWCFEYADWTEDPRDFVSRCPIAMDGTCSGLQHYSALLRDKRGAVATNLTHTDAPQDIYGEVARVCAEKVQKALSSTEEVPATERRPAVPVRRWARVWHGKIDRSVCKPGTMTVPYGVTSRGMSEQLVDMVDSGKVELTTDDAWGACNWFSKVLAEAINEVVISAEEGKQWLRQVGNALAKANKDIHWVTPLGLQVRQDYKRWSTKRVETLFGGIRYSNQLRTGKTKKVDIMKATNGVAPNFIHSLDATHLMMTALELPEGVNLCVIHDSFGTHAADVDIMRETLKKTFHKLYSEHDHLSELLEGISDKESLEGLPEEFPPVGELDIREVLNSDYLFS